MLGLVLFSLASFAGGIAQSEGWLLTARAAQGLGAAMVSPAALSIITVTFAEGAERNRALGIWGVVVGAGGARRRVLGGDLTSGLNWRWVLFVSVPIGIAAAALAPRTLRESRADDGASTFDLPGAVAVTAGLSTRRLRDRRRRERRLGIRGDAGQDRRCRRPAGRVPGHRAARAPPADAVLDLPPAHAARSGHGRPPHRHVVVLDVLLHLAVPAGRARLLADQDGRLVPAARGRDHCRGGGCLAARHPYRLQAGADRRHAAHRRRPDLVLAGARPRRLLPRRRARPVAAGRDRAGALVRARHDRRGDRDRAPGRPASPPG